MCVRPGQERRDGLEGAAAARDVGLPAGAIFLRCRVVKSAQDVI